MPADDDAVRIAWNDLITVKSSDSLYLDVRGVRYHIRTWGDPEAPKVFALHGWMDTSATFQFLVDALKGEWHIIAPDWRGFGLSDWTRELSWHPSYVTDLEVLLRYFQPELPVNLLGHSLGGVVACLYAGIRPERVAKLVTIEGFGITFVSGPVEQAPKYYAEWIAQAIAPDDVREYDSIDTVVHQLRSRNPRLENEQAQFLAHHWLRQLNSGKFRAATDLPPKLVNAVLLRLDEAKAYWRRITAPVLWIGGANSKVMRSVYADPQDYESRKACYSRLEVHVIENAGHNVHHDEPHQLASVVESFFACR